MLSALQLLDKGVTRASLDRMINVAQSFTCFRPAEPVRPAASR